MTTIIKNNNINPILSQGFLIDIYNIKISISEHIIQIIIPIASIKYLYHKYQYKKRRYQYKKSKYTTFFINTFKKNNFGKYEFDYDDYKINFESFVDFINKYIKTITIIEIFINTTNIHNHSILCDFLNLDLFLNVKLILGSKFDYPIDLCIYNNIKTIYIKGKSRKNLSNLPKNLINLYLSKYHHYDAKIPQVKNLYFNDSYNKKIILDNTNIDNIIIGCAYDKSILFGSSIVKSLELKNNNKFIIKEIPHTIEIINIDSSEYNLELDFLPNSVKELTLNSYLFNKNLDNLPNSIIKLKLILSENYSNSLSNLPNSIEELTISDYLIFKICKLPNALKILNIKTTTYNYPDEFANIFKKKINTLLENFDEKSKPEIYRNHF